MIYWTNLRLRTSRLLQPSNQEIRKQAWRHPTSKCPLQSISKPNPPCLMGIKRNQLFLRLWKRTLLMILSDWTQPPYLLLPFQLQGCQVPQNLPLEPPDLLLQEERQ